MFSGQLLQISFEFFSLFVTTGDASANFVDALTQELWKFLGHGEALLQCRPRETPAFQDEALANEGWAQRAQLAEGSELETPWNHRGQKCPDCSEATCKYL